MYFHHFFIQNRHFYNEVSPMLALVLWYICQFLHIHLRPYSHVILKPKWTLDTECRAGGSWSLGVVLPVRWRCTCQCLRAAWWPGVMESAEHTSTSTHRGSVLSWYSEWLHTLSIFFIMYMKTNCWCSFLFCFRLKLNIEPGFLFGGCASGHPNLPVHIHDSYFSMWS